MVYRGTFQNGVVVLEPGASVPEGAEVSVQVLAPESVATHDRDPRIVCTKGICGGLPRVKGSRMPVWVLLSHRKKRTPDSKILELFPYLRQEDLDAAWLYAKRHPQLAVRRE